MIRIFQRDSRFIKGVFTVIIGAAIITMVVTLVPGIFDNGAANDATVFATVRTPGFFGRFSGDSSQVRTADVQREVEAQMQRQRLPDFYRQFLAGRVAQQQVERQVLLHEANRLGLQVSDDDLRRELRTGALSQYIFPDGKYIGDDKYLNFVQSSFQMSVSDFEAIVKTDLELQRLQSLITGGVSVADSAVRADYMQSGTKAKFDYVTISSADLKKTINPSDSDLQAYFKQAGARYANAVPEQRKITFAAFDASSLPGGKPQISDAEINAYYSAHQNDYKVEEQIKTRHILITAAKGVDAATDAAAKAKAEDVLKQLKAGGNFAELAKKYSDDPGSKTQGGELPMFPTSGLDPAYSAAAMKLAPGQTSDVVRSQFGYHIIQTEEKHAAGTKSLPEVKDSIVQLLQQQKVGADEQKFANQLEAEAKKDGIEKAAAAHNLHVVTTDYIGHDATIPSLPESTALLTAAFGAAKGAAPAVASTGEGFALFQVVDVRPAHAPDFADYKSHLLDDYRDAHAPELLQQQLAKLDARAKALADLKKAAAEMNLTVKTSDLVGRDGQVPDVGALTGQAAEVFTLPKGGITAPINEGPTGVVMQVVDKQEPTPDDIAKNFSATKDKLLDAQRQEVFGVFIGSLMQKYEKAGAIIYSKRQQQPSPLSR